MDLNIEEECPICFYDNADKECIILDCCNKYIHKDCIDIWIIKNINSNKFAENKCIYCCKTNKYINNFINNNNHQIININEQMENTRIVERNVTINQNITILNYFKCVFFLSFSILLTIAIGSILRTTLN